MEEQNNQPTNQDHTTASLTITATAINYLTETGNWPLQQKIMRS